jgi:hypothetical protein
LEATTFAKPRITFDITIDQPDLDQYAPKAAAPKPHTASAGASKILDWRT